MSNHFGRRFYGIAVAFALLALAAAPPAEAQREYEPLFDKFNFKLEGSWVGMTTEIRLDSDGEPPSASRTTSTSTAERPSRPSPSSGRSPKSTVSVCVGKTSAAVRTRRR